MAKLGIRKATPPKPGLNNPMKQDLKVIKEIDSIEPKISNALTSRSVNGAGDDSINTFSNDLKK